MLLLDYIITARRRKGTLPENAAAISTIVTSKMVRRICDVNDIHFDETFTGFKFMAEKLAEYQRDGSYQYVLAFEESYGFHDGRLCPRQGRRDRLRDDHGDGGVLLRAGHDARAGARRAV
ncbi:MAG: hypothetical protein ACLSHG_13340 [Oscillospiraceae bacterium]